jgi:hypothetical protein
MTRLYRRGKAYIDDLVGAQHERGGIFRPSARSAALAGSAHQPSTSSHIKVPPHVS